MAGSCSLLVFLVQAARLHFPSAADTHACTYVCASRRRRQSVVESAGCRRSGCCSRRRRRTCVAAAPSHPWPWPKPGANPRRGALVPFPAGSCFSTCRTPARAFHNTHERTHAHVRGACIARFACRVSRAALSAANNACPDGARSSTVARFRCPPNNTASRSDWVASHWHWPRHRPPARARWVAVCVCVCVLTMRRGGGCKSSSPARRSSVAEQSQPQLI